MLSLYPSTPAFLYKLLWPINNPAVIWLQAFKRESTQKKKLHKDWWSWAASLIKNHRTQCCILDCLTCESSVKGEAIDPVTGPNGHVLPQGQGTQQSVLYLWCILYCPINSSVVCHSLVHPFSLGTVRELYHPIVE